MRLAGEPVDVGLRAAAEVEDVEAVILELSFAIKGSSEIDGYAGFPCG